MNFYPENALQFLADTWKVWVVFTILSLAGYSLWWYLTQQRTYRAVGGKAQVKHGRLGHWQDLQEHLQDHKEVK